MMKESYVPTSYHYGYECIRDFCGYISGRTNSHLDNEIWTRNLLLLKYFPEAIDVFCKEYKDSPLYHANYKELKDTLSNENYMVDLYDNNVAKLIMRDTTEDLSFDEIASICDCLYVNIVPAIVESIAYKMVKPEMCKYGFSV